MSIYSSANCHDSIREQIKKIYNLDGPGIPDCNEAENIYAKIEKKLVTIVPQSSIIGRLFEQHDDHFIVHSNAEGVNQHDTLTWQVMGCELVPDKEFLSDSVGVGDHIRTTINSLTPEGREAFVETFFTLLFSTGSKTLTDLAKKIPTLFSQYFKLTKEQRKAINGPLIKLFSNKYIRRCLVESTKSFGKTHKQSKFTTKKNTKKKPPK